MTGFIMRAEYVHPLEKAAVLEATKDSIPDLDLLWVKTSKSTNADLMKMAETGGKEWTVIVADEQTEGRGRHKRPWVNSPNGLYFSVLLRLHQDSPPITLIPLVIGMALQEAITELAANKGRGIQSWLKWPNDLLTDNGKLAGILCETALDKKIWMVVAGVGINLNPLDSNDKGKLTGDSTSLFDETGLEWAREELLSLILIHINKRVTDWKRNPEIIRDSYLRHSGLIGKYITVKTGKGQIEGSCEGINHIGALRIRTKDGLKEINAAEGIEIHQ